MSVESDLSLQVAGASENLVSRPALLSAPATQQLWFCAYPFFEATLLVVPPSASSLAPFGSSTDDSFPVWIRLFDADGGIVNEMECQFSKSEVATLELEQALSACKLESGLKHGQCEVRLPGDALAYVQLYARHSAPVIGKMALVNSEKAEFFPVTFAAGRSYALAAINLDQHPAQLRVKLILGNRTPEVVVEIPAHGARLVSLAAEFSEFATVEGDRTLQAYVRLTTRSEAGIGLQLLERVEAGQEDFFYGIVS